MGSERHRTARPGGEARAQERELLSSLHAAVDTLAACLERIEDLIHQVDGHLTDGGDLPVHPPRAHVSYGGGASVIGTHEQGPVVEGVREHHEPAVGSREATRGFREVARGLTRSGSLDFRESAAGSAERRRGLERRAGGEERRISSERRLPRQGETRNPGTPALMAATELAHKGFSREQIAERLRERWGDRAAAILREALD
jgi:hypothetical protein